MGAQAASASFRAASPPRYAQAAASRQCAIQAAVDDVWGKRDSGNTVVSRPQRPASRDAPRVHRDGIGTKHARIKAAPIADLQGDIRNFYDLERLLGHGSFGAVWQATKRFDVVVSAEKSGDTFGGGGEADAGAGASRGGCAGAGGGGDRQTGVEADASDGHPAHTGERVPVAVKAVAKFHDVAVFADAKTAAKHPNRMLPEALRAAKRRSLDRVKQEIAMLKLLSHKNIVRLETTCEDDFTVFLVMELCAGGTIIDHVLKAGRLSEQMVALVMRQVFDATQYCHSQHICHRDLKPVNVLVHHTLEPFITSVSSSPVEEAQARLVCLEQPFIKVADFGLSCAFVPGQDLCQVAGTLEYIAPQVLHGRYGPSCDLWSCGVTLYKLLCGYTPFFHEREEVLLEKTRRGNYGFISPDWVGVSEDARSLVRQLLRMDPTERATADQALAHDWRPCNWQLTGTLARLCHQQHSEVEPAPSPTPGLAGMSRVLLQSGGDWVSGAAYDVSFSEDFDPSAEALAHEAAVAIRSRLGEAAVVACVHDPCDKPRCVGVQCCDEARPPGCAVQACGFTVSCGQSMPGDLVKAS